MSGRVLDGQTGTPVQNAAASLVGHGSMLTDGNGAFFFTGVALGTHRLRADAIGYVVGEWQVEVRRDTMLIVSLEPAPIALDSLRVTLRGFDLNGRVRDPALEGYVARATVRSDQGHEETTSLTGRFELDDVYEGPRLRLVIRAFRYLPLDTVFTPERNTDYSFDVTADPVIGRMIDRYEGQLEARSAARLYAHQGTLDRAALARLQGNISVWDALLARYPDHVVRRIVCFVFDEREYRFQSTDERRAVLEGTFVNDLERIEILEFPGMRRIFMARVYTRRFFRAEVGNPRELRDPVLTITPGGVICR